MAYDRGEFLGRRETAEASEELAHYGVKGMKWGVRKEDDLVGRKTKNQTESADSKRKKAFEENGARIQAELKRRGHNDIDSALLQAKYETPEGENPTKRLSRNQKIAIGVGVGVVGAALIGYAAYKGGAFDKDSPLMTTINERFTPETLTKRFAERPESASLFTAKHKAYGSATDGLKLNWDSDVSLSPGSIIKRVSSVAETKIREGGFYGAFREDDVKSYTAVLPSFWARWQVGVPMDGGFINHYAAGAEVKAPSGKKTVELLKKFVNTDADFKSRYSHIDFQSLKDEEFGDFLKSFSLGWVNDEDRSVRSFFNLVKDEGFNALIDFNDAGVLGKTPLRVIDPSIFNIVKNEVLNFEAMVQAAEAWDPALIHFWDDHMALDKDEFLEHYGVKGMKWGVRRGGSDDISRKTSREAKRDADEFSKAKMFYGEGAGNRRKLIKATVESKSQKDPNYKKAFEQHLNNQDMARRASQARGERRRKDTVNSAAKTARGVKNIIMQNGAPVALSAVVLVAAARNPQVQSIVTRVGKTAYDTVKNSPVVDLIKNQMSG